MELFFLCTALSLHVLDHCMKLYWKRKTQRTAGPTARPPGDSYIPPQTSFRGYNNTNADYNFCIWKQQKTYSNIVDQELLESIRHNVPLFFSCTITNVWHQVLALETTTHSVVNTLWSTPVLLKEICNHR